MVCKLKSRNNRRRRVLSKKSQRLNSLSLATNSHQTLTRLCHGKYMKTIEFPLSGAAEFAVKIHTSLHNLPNVWFKYLKIRMCSSKESRAIRLHRWTFQFRDCSTFKIVLWCWENCLSESRETILVNGYIINKLFHCLPKASVHSLKVIGREKRNLKSFSQKKILNKFLNLLEIAF